MCAVYGGTRIRNIIQQALYAREVPSYNAFVRESKLTLGLVDSVA